MIIRKNGPSQYEWVDEEYEFIKPNILCQTLRHRKGSIINAELIRIYHRVT
jgi:hypothetical protein